MQAFFVVFLGAGIGGALRHAVNLLAGRWIGINFPYGTLIVNVAGSLVMGLLCGYFAFREEMSPELKLFLTTGVLGGFTTFSAFALDAVLLYERHESVLATLYILASVALALSGVMLGILAVRHFS